MSGLDEWLKENQLVAGPWTCLRCDQNTGVTLEHDCPNPSPAHSTSFGQNFRVVHRPSPYARRARSKRKIKMRAAWFRTLQEPWYKGREDAMLYE